MILVSSASPPETPNATRGMSMLNKFAYWVSKTWYWLLKTAVKAEADEIQKKPIEKLQSVLATGPADSQVYMTNPAIERAFVTSALEMYSRPHGYVAESMDYWLFCHPWGFDLAALPKDIKYHVWYGMEDQSVVPAMGEYLGSLLPGSKVHALEEKGHLLFFEIWRDILTAALA